MPGFKTHKKVGAITAVLVGVLILLFYNQQVTLTALEVITIPFIILIYSQIPDLDSHTSRIKKRFIQACFGLMIFAAVIAMFSSYVVAFALLVAAGVFGLLLYKLPHRGPLHTFWFIGLVSAPLLYFNWFLAVLAFSCGASHIIADNVFSSTKRKAKKIFGMRSEKHYHYSFFGNK